MSDRKKDIDLLLKRAYKSIESPDASLIQNVKYSLIKENSKVKISKRPLNIAVAVVLMIFIITGTVVAGWHFLKPSEVANKFEDNTLSAAFDGADAILINESVSSGDYTFTLIGIVSGKAITDHPYYSDEDLRDDRSYTVVAIQKADGTPMPSAQEEEYLTSAFYVSPYVKGLRPWQVNAHTLNGGYSEVVENGIMYRILQNDEISIFADRGVYLGISTSNFYDSNAFHFNEETGEITVTQDYIGANAIFDLPLDPSQADKEKADEYLKTLGID